MAKPETPSEVVFLKLLDDYCNLLSGHEHIGSDEETLRRAMVWYSTEDLFKATAGLIKILHGMGEVLSAAKEGGIRACWGAELADVCRAMIKFGDALHLAHELRYH